MASNWVWRHDGTRQCEQGNEESLEEAREQLVTIIGNENILAGEKRTLPTMIITVCGAPTGQVNAFQLTEEGYHLLFHGIAGTLGFRPWSEAVKGMSSGKAIAFATLQTDQQLESSERVSVIGTRRSTPEDIEGLYGRECRVYNVGDMLTKDLKPGRFNIGLERGRIKEMWFG